MAVVGDRLSARLALCGTPLTRMASEAKPPKLRWQGANDGQVGVHGCPRDAGNCRVHAAVELLQRLPHELRLSHALQVARAGGVEYFKGRPSGPPVGGRAGYPVGGDTPVPVGRLGAGFY